MSGLLDQAGLTAGSGLSNGAGLYKWGNFNPFDPTDLDPYLLFDTAAGSMIGTLENPTLDLDPSNQETLDVITATRASVATRTLSDGSIALTEQDTVRVDYTQGAELTPTKFQNIGYTDFSSGRVLSNFGTGVIPVLSLDALGSPNGTEDAYKIVFNAGSGTTSGDGSELYFNVSEIEDNIQSTASIFLRGENGGEQLVFRGASNGSYQLVTLTTEWQRFTTTENTNPSGNQKLTFGIRQSVSGHGVINSAATIYAYGPQLEEGTTASDFVANTTGSPKFISSAVYSDKVAMVLIEPSAENLVTNSSSFSALSGATLISNIDAPDGSDDAKRVSNAQAINTTFAKSSTISIPTGVAADYVGSVYVRGTAGNTVNVFMKRASGGPFVTSGGRSVLLTGDWQRVENLALTSDPTNANLAIYASSAGETADLIDLWGGQIETGSVSTSVIPTSGSTVQRAADDLVISGSDFDFYNQSEGTVYVEYEPRIVSSTNCLFTFSDGTTSHRILSLVSESYSLFINNGSNLNYFSVNVDPQANNLNRLACTFKTNNASASLNGSTGDYDTSLTMPVNSRLNLGTRQDGSQPLNGHIKRLLYFPTHSSRL